MHIVYFVNRVGPYHDARFRSFPDDVKLTVVEFFYKDSTYSWGKLSERPYRSITLFEDENSFSLSYLKIRKRVFDVLKDLQPDVLAVPGWTNTCAFLAVEFGRYFRIPMVLLSDNFRFENFSIYERIVKRFLVTRFSAALTAGKPHFRFLCEMGLEPERVFEGYDAVDNDYFFDKNKEPYFDRSRPYLLCVARLVKEKNLSSLIRAYSLSNAKNSYDLVLAGDGPEYGNLRSLAREFGVEENVVFLGFVDYETLPSLYSNASLFTLVSVSETWGLSVNEAMASSLPVVVSKNCGCSEDLVISNINGLIVDPLNLEDIAKSIDSVVFRSEIDQMGEASKKIISQWGLQKFSAGMKAAAASAMAYNSTSRMPRWLEISILRLLLWIKNIKLRF